MTIYNWIIIIFWLIFWIYWLVSSVGKKKVIKRENAASRYWGFILVILAVLLAQWSGANALVFSRSQPVLLLGVILCGAGILFAVWARLHLGRNWNIEPSIQENHELVTSGPYKYVRHPIYTGVLTAFLGSALVGGVAWIIIFIFVCVVFVWRVKTEERLMTGLFPGQYPEYKKRTKALIPFVW